MRLQVSLSPPMRLRLIVHLSQHLQQMPCLLLGNCCSLRCAQRCACQCAWHGSYDRARLNLCAEQALVARGWDFEGVAILYVTAVMQMLCYGITASTVCSNFIANQTCTVRRGRCVHPAQVVTFTAIAPGTSHTGVVCVLLSCHASHSMPGGRSIGAGAALLEDAAPDTWG